MIFKRNKRTLIISKPFGLYFQVVPADYISIYEIVGFGAMKH